jgi:phosphoribosylformimino-5-aminoimidazole carboxamide ribotide isomerase
MEVIPAVDIKGGKCVRLWQGRADREEVFSLDPVEMSRRWEREGAPRLHVVDLDGAFGGTPRNLPIVRKIIQTLSCPVQIGGGIRSLETLEIYFQSGVDRMILGTVALENPALLKDAAVRFPEKVWVGVDLKEGRIATKGWTQLHVFSLTEWMEGMKNLPIGGVVLTDISRDGTQEGLNLDFIKKTASRVGRPVIIAGGISTLEDIRQALSLAHYGVIGVITGKALYKGTLSLSEALSLTKSLT